MRVKGMGAERERKKRVHTRERENESEGERNQESERERERKKEREEKRDREKKSQGVSPTWTFYKLNFDLGNPQAKASIGTRFRPRKLPWTHQMLFLLPRNTPPCNNHLLDKRN
jgi:hypothetical protein